MRSLQWEQVHARRLARNHLAERAPPERLADVVRDICGVQAQVAAASELALAVRVDGITREDVRAALWERRELVKAWTLRGTLHLHAADDLPLWIAARRTAVYWREPRWLETFGLTIDEAEAIVAAIGDALAGLVSRWRAGTLDGTALTPADRDRLSRAERVEELAELLRSVE